MTVDLSDLDSFSLNNAPWREQVLRILAAALNRVEPAAAVARYVQREGQHLVVADRVYDLYEYGRIFLVGAGKAGAPMAYAVGQLLGGRLTKGLVIVKAGYSDKEDELISPDLDMIEAGHPLPDQRGLEATERIVRLLDSTREDDLVICLVSGGGSALLTAPGEGISLQDLRTLTEALLRCGATVSEINTLRKHLDQIKGGRLARLASPASVAALILSDVVGDPLDMIASGPTVPDSTTYADALDVLVRYNLMSNIPTSIVRYLERGASGFIPETPKPGERLFNRVQNVIIGSNLLAAQAALQQAGAEGFQTLLLTTSLQGEASQAGRVLASILRQVVESGQPIARPACIVLGGETTVTIQGDGLGGRNQELALGAVYDLSGLPGVALISLATDGGDGLTDAAGAVVTGETYPRALRAGMNPQHYLACNNSYHFFSKLGDLLKTGPTRTNVNDLVLLCAFPHSY